MCKARGKQEWKSFSVSQFFQLINHRLSQNCIVLICPNEPRWEKGSRVWTNQSQRWTHSHPKDNQTPFDTTSCLIYTLQLPAFPHVCITWQTNQVPWEQTEPGSHLQPYGGWDRAKLFYSLCLVLFLISHQVPSCRPPELLSSCSNMILAMLVICRTIGSLGMWKGQAEVLVQAPTLKLIHKQP